jgi:hypothetical protein
VVTTGSRSTRPPNAAAIRAYEKVGFRAVGVMRQYERDVDGGGWHDGLLMELLAEECAGNAEVRGLRPLQARPQLAGAEASAEHR